MSKLSLENLSTDYNGLENFLQVSVDAQDDLAPQIKNTQEETIYLL